MRKRFRSIQFKLSVGFVLIILVIMTITVFLHVRSTEAIRESIYTRMLNNVSYFQRSLDRELEHISQMQIDFFQDRNLPFLTGTESLLNDYERREAFLQVQERLRAVTGTSSLVEDGTLYFPKTGYVITESRIGIMTSAQREEMTNYLQVGNSDLHYINHHFFMARTGEVRTGFSTNPGQLLVIRFSTEEMQRQLEAFSEGNGGGAFLYSKSNEVLIAGDATDLGKEIYQALKKDETGRELSTQRIRVGGKNYLALAQMTETGALIVQYTPEDEVTAWIRQSWMLALLFLAVMIAFAAAFIFYVQRVVNRPLRTLYDAFGQVEQGRLTEHIHHEREDEFSYIYDRFNETEDHLSWLIDEVYVQKNLVQKAQMKQLQAQINPHFLYNSFFILSRRIHRQDMEGAEALANHLGNYFKYLSRDQSDDISLAEEAAHAQSYAAIQGTRFASRLEVHFQPLPEHWRNFRVPRLILQPLLENAFKYGLEDKAEDGKLRVSFREEGRNLRILVEDNGEKPVDLTAIRDSLEENDPQVISGMANIHRRLRIYFHGRSGLQITKSELGGLAVVILLPGEEEE